ncbi:GMC oxidoreductase [Crassisporium funariophilum]|nr:GMC oxidoreductase [Crassisporium funariophilum]
MPIVGITDVSQKSFDYVVVGGGTAGLTLATRLSEDPSLSILVLEAGEANLDDPKIVMPGQFAQTFMNPKYDWGFMTTKQKHSNDQQKLWARGKGLGGSSGMNFYCWVKPPAADIDAFEKLGNPGWNWADYQKYSMKSETFHAPSKEITDLYPHTFDLSLRGTSGPIQTTIPSHISTVDAIYQQTVVNKGLKTIKDPYGGDITGTWMASVNLDPKDWSRSYSASAYLRPNLTRKNLTVLTEAFVTRVLFGDTTDSQDLTATGVEFLYNDKVYAVKANKEVVLSAGAIKDPQILELSGIGRADILSKIGVDLKLELPGVGENVQEHHFFGISFELNPNTPHETFDLMADPTYAEEAKRLYALGKGLQRTAIASFSYFPVSAANPKDTPAIIDKLEEEVKARDAKGELPAGLKEQLDIQIAVLRDDTLPDCEIAAFPGFFTSSSKPEPGKSYITILPMVNHPISRGTIHAVSKDAKDHPEMDPHYFECDTDLEIMVQQFKFARSFADVEPWKSAVVREVDPGPLVQSDEEIRDYIKNTHSSTWHTAGSCSMLPRNKLGVVDPQLKVYGTTNLRIVDISIIPLHIAAHTQATAYVIGEKAADIIKSGL